MLSWHSTPKLPHLAFVAMMRLGGHTVHNPTLFQRVNDPAQDATAGTCCMGCLLGRCQFTLLSEREATIMISALRNLLISLW